MCTRDVNAACLTVVQFDINVPHADDRVVQLSRLVALGRIRIKIVFTVEDAFEADFGINGEAEFYGHAQGFFVKYWQYARQAEINSARLGVGFGAVGG